MQVDLTKRFNHLPTFFSFYGTLAHFRHFRHCPYSLIVFFKSGTVSGLPRTM